MIAISLLLAGITFVIGGLIVLAASDGEWPISIVLTGVVLMFAAMAVGLVDMANDDKRLKEACLSDGHKEYECEGMLRHNNIPIPMPIVIPMPMGR